MLEISRRASATILTCGVALSIGACGGVINFSDTTAIAIPGPAPAVPPPQDKRVQVKTDRIDIAEKIQFDLDQATIKPESYGLLDEVTAVFVENPQIKKVDVVGHTSSEGDATYNKTLSQKRARAVVEYLTSHGIAQGRLASKGMGKDQPIADNNREPGRERNRRVEFLIVTQDLGAGSEGDK